MTLYRQLLFCTLLTLVVLCAGLWMGELKRTRDFLVNQMESHAQDTATSLGLSLGTLTDGSDMAAMETMINALFDRGYYRFIQLHDVKGTLLIDRNAELTLEGVPAWFIRLIPLATPRAQSLIMQGWRQMGTVTVESHPGYAYYSLWESALNTAHWFLLTTLIAAVLGGLGLRRLLQPLARVEEQALALCDRRFHVQGHLPRTRELRRVVIAMNQMTARIQEMFDEQTAIADALLQRTYQDPLTAAGNRRFLEAQIKARLEDKAPPVQGAFLIFQIQELQTVNRENGYQAGDQLIKDTVAGIQQACADLPEALIARLGGGDLALFLPNTDESTTARIADTIMADFYRQAGLQPPVTAGTLACGGVLYERPATCGELLTRADTALNTARYHRYNKVVLVPLTEGEAVIVAGKTEWKALLETILANQTIALYSQPTVRHRDRQQIVHHEILTRVIDASGNHLSAGLFIPIAEQLGLMPALDRIILEQIFNRSWQHLKPQRLAINLSPLSLADSEFTAWLHGRLAQCAREGLHLNVEFPEFRAIRHRHLIKTFAADLKTMGHGLGIDHFGQGLMHFGYLKSLLPDYVKIDRAITNEMRNEQSDSYFFINALCNVAHSLDIKVIVEGIEQEEQWQTLAGIHIDAVQGFLVQRPEPLDSGGA
jgi:diguanylate cyclase (GGDEF)-like protein